MKLPAILTLGFILSLTIWFMWAISPRKKIPEAPIKTAAHSKLNPVKTVKTLTPLTAAQRARIAQYAKDWPENPAYDTDFNALDPSYKVAELSNSLFDPIDDYWGLPRDDKEAYELVDAYCTACHSASIVMQQRATPERWKELLVWMEQTQGMAKIPDEDEVLILEYIGTHFSTN